jgi:hypothetical protein
MGDVAADSPVTSISGQERDVTLALRLSRSLQVEVVGLKQRRVVLRRAVVTSFCALVASRLPRAS